VSVLPEGIGLDEGVLVAYDVWGVEGGEDADLVEGVLLFFVGEVVHLHFFEGVDLGVDDALHLVDGGVGPLAQLGNYHEVLQRHATIFIIILHPPPTVKLPNKTPISCQKRKKTDKQTLLCGFFNKWKYCFYFTGQK